MPFNFIKTKIEGLTIIEPRKFPDGRGFFMETYKRTDFVNAGIDLDFVQDNHSCSSKGVLRGLHFQNKGFEQGKLVRVTRGSVWDVAVDLRKESTTYGEWIGVELTEENGRLFYLPPGFAHGFLTLSDNTHFLYKCTAEYAPNAEGGLRWNDADIGVDWPLNGIMPIFSDKDLELPFLRELKLGSL
ncbi:MAG: dTDP-4-dehydrorhamnose 3,5-epimerase [Spirochaetales bacterium]|nr:dTDP-4-dehydrorhamnose 3,5-epimerase [Spirochaetales bacterium]